MKKVTRDLQENFATGKAHKVDRATGVIEGVKVCGLESPNKHGLKVEGTTYSRAALQEALPLYEGRKVFIDHPPRSNPDVERSVRDIVGVLREARIGQDGVYANLHYPPNSETGKHVADLAESMPECFGLSHNAKGVGRVVGGKYLIESIPSVRSVDIVSQPATTRGMFESKEQPMTVKESAAKLALETKSPIWAKLLEDDAAMPTEADYKDHLSDAVKAVLADDSMDLAAKKKKILAIIKASDDSEPEPKKEDGPPKVAVESKMVELETKVATLQREKDIRDLCESEGFKPSAVQLEALGLLPEGRRKDFIAEAKKAPAKATAPKTGTRNITESGEKPSDNKGWLSRLKSPARN